MCYDFHLAGDIPRLIEVNTNAGGGLLACMACDPSLTIDRPAVPDKLKATVLQMFADEFRAFSAGHRQKPESVVIVDDNPPGQYLYPEMCAFAELFTSWGAVSGLTAPETLDFNAEGLRFGGRPVEMLYNRHCDFYLETDAMAGIRSAYLNGQVCLTPNPHMYGLLADKRRLALWSSSQNLCDWALTPEERDLIALVLPNSALLADLDLAQTWTERKRHAFKPVDSFGSRGVLMGEKISRKRFDELPLETTLAQELVPPSMTEVPGYGVMKTDFRLFAYRDRVLGITARLYRGQVTNMRTPGGGFARVELV